MYSLWSLINTYTCYSIVRIRVRSINFFSTRSVQTRNICWNTGCLSYWRVWHYVYTGKETYIASLTFLSTDLPAVAFAQYYWGLLHNVFQSHDQTCMGSYHRNISSPKGAAMAQNLISQSLWTTYRALLIERCHMNREPSAGEHQKLLKRPRKHCNTYLSLIFGKCTCTQLCSMVLHRPP